MLLSMWKSNMNIRRFWVLGNVCRPVAWALEVIIAKASEQKWLERLGHWFSLTCWKLKNLKLLEKKWPHTEGSSSLTPQTVTDQHILSRLGNHCQPGLNKPSRQVAKSVTSPPLDSAMGFVLWGFRPVLEVLAKHSGPGRPPGGPVRSADLRVRLWRNGHWLANPWNPLRTARS